MNERRRRQRIERVAEDYLDALQSCRAPDIETLAAAHPAIAGALRVRLRVVAMVHRAAGERDGGAAGPGGAAEAIPERIGRFRVAGLLGRGSFGTVYRAVDPDLGREVALKVPRLGALVSVESRQRLLREARSAARLRHPAIVAVHEIGVEEGMPFIVSELVRGRSLAELMAERRLGFQGAAQLAFEVAGALDCAHREGVTHRDVKPANIIVDSDGRPHVSDFGLARFEDEDAATLTLEGQVLGTPAYMPPEQAAGDRRAAGPKSDIYSLGVVLYELLAGERPFGGSRSAVIHQVLNVEPRPPRTLDRRIPVDLETICLKAMAKEPRRRYETAAELGADLRRFLAGEPIRARPAGRIDRLWRWSRKNPLVASLAAFSALLLFSAALASTAAALWYGRESARVGKLADEHREAREAATSALARNTELLGQKDAALRRAQALRLTALSAAVLPSNPAQALLLAIEGAETEPGLLATNALLGALGATRELRTLLGHSGAVIHACFSAGGSRCLSTAGDGTIRVWDAATGRLRSILRGHKVQVNHAAFSPDGRRIASGSWDSTVRIWDAESGAQLRTLSCGNIVRRVEFSADGRWVAAALHAGNVRLWNFETGAVVELAHREPAPHASFNPDGGRVVTSSDDGTARIWSRDGALLLELAGHEGGVAAASFSPDGSRVVTASVDGTARVWDASSGASAVLAGHLGALSDAVYSPDGTRVLTASADGTARLWDPAGDGAVVVLAGHDEGVTAASFAPDGRRVITASADGTARIWDSASGAEIAVLAGHWAAVRTAQFDPAGRRVVTASIDGTARLWNGDTAAELAAAGRDGFRGLSVWPSPDWTVAAIPGRHAIVELRAADSGRRLAELAGHQDLVNHACFSPDGTRVATASRDRTARIWDAASGAELRRLDGHRDWVDGASFSADGRRLVTASRDWTARIWDAESGALLHTLSNPRGWVAAACFSPDGAYVAAAGSSAAIWNAATGALVRVLTSADVYAAAFSPDGGRLAVAAADHRVTLWAIGSGRRSMAFEGHEGKVTSMAFSADGRLLASAGQDRTARVWSATDGRPLAAVTSRRRGFRAARVDAAAGELRTLSLDGIEESWPLDPLPVALARKPRLLTALEAERLEIGSREERVQRAIEEARALRREARAAAVAMCRRYPESESVRRQIAVLLGGQLDAARGAAGAAEELEEMVSLVEEWTGDCDPPLLRRAAALLDGLGQRARALRLLERIERHPYSAGDAGVAGELRERRRKLRPAALSFRSIDAAFEELDAVVLVGRKASWRYLPGVSSPAEGCAWTARGFDDAAWEEGAGDFGDSRREGVATVLDEMPARYGSLYLRSSFRVDDPSRLIGAAVSVEVRDGCIVWLDAVEIARIYVSPVDRLVGHDGAALDLGVRHGVERIWVPPSLLAAGDNVIAVHALTSRRDRKGFGLAVEVAGIAPPDAGRDDALAAEIRSAAAGEDGVRLGLYLEGRLLQRRGRHREAAERFERIAAAGSDDLAVRCRLIESLRAAGESAGADRRLRRLLEDEIPASADDPLRLQLAAWWIARQPDRPLEDYVRARSWVRRAAGVMPGKYEDVFGGLLARLGFDDEALLTIRLLQSGRERPHPDGAAVEAVVLARLGETESARAAARRLHELAAGEDWRKQWDAWNLLLEAERRLPPPEAPSR
jgi:WD40 repeat protein